MYLEEPTVTAECINSTRSWCYGTGWPETQDYAPTQQAAFQSISDLAAIFTTLSTHKKATATITLGSLSATYNGTAKSVTATTSPSGLTVTFTYDPIICIALVGVICTPVDAGTYSVVATVSDANYQGTISLPDTFSKLF
jgi:hypothetical protein